ncbi:MAG: 7-cyano-7-deazaguanine synthase QueC [Bacteriovoracaceae bacterium]|nr:7-cyano-7-deazaguanine synthase QueC [Bacteriovoracaceae bacterium]
MALKKKAVVVLSGGMDSSLCLALASKEFGPQNVLALSFDYSQRHSIELSQAKKIAAHFKVDHVVLEIKALAQITESALLNKNEITHKSGEAPNTMVIGRNGLMARLAGIHAHSLGADCIYMGVMELESANSGYRDCSREYMDLIEKALRMDFASSTFEIRTPLMRMNKEETMELAHSLGVIEFLLENTVTCYEGILHEGCLKCPACKLRNSGVRAFIIKHPDVNFSWKTKI